MRLFANKAGFILGLALLVPVSGQADPAGRALCEQLVEKAYPAEVAGYNKARATAYTDNCSDYSVAYNYDVNGVQIAATFYNYEYPDLPDFKAHFKEVSTAIPTISKDAVLIGEDSVTLVNHGLKFDGLRAAYKLKGKFAGQEQELYSEVILLKNNTGYIKLRTTTPVANYEAAQRNSLKLLSELNWPR